MVKMTDGSTNKLVSRNIIIATGSEVTPFPGIPIDEQQVLYCFLYIKKKRAKHFFAV